MTKQGNESGGAKRTKKKPSSELPSSEEALRLLEEKGADEDLIAHCRAVSELAGKIANRCREPVDKDLVKIGGLLHDLGRISTHGIAHGVEGGNIARSKGLPTELVKIIERHLGAGLSSKDAERLGLPKRSFIPITIEEKIVAHADNLISGAKRAPVSEAIARFVRLHEEEGAKRILELHKELSELCEIDIDLL